MSTEEYQENELNISQMFATFKEYLLKLNYPCINSLSRDEIADIFSTENRTAFLTWIIKNIDSELALTNNADLSNFLCESGFASSSLMKKYVEGESVDIEEQLKILIRIFSFVIALKSDEELDEAWSQNNFQQECEQKLKLNLDLFPSLAPVLVKANNAKVNCDDILALKNKIAEFEQNASTEVISELSTITKEELQNLKDRLNDFQSSVLPKLTLEFAECKSVSDIKDVKDDIVGCSKKLRTISQNFENMIALNNTSIETTHLKSNDHEDMPNLMDELAKWLSKIEVTQKLDG